MYLKRPLCLYSAVFAAVLYLVVSLFPLKLSQYALLNDNKTVTITGKIEKKDIKNDKIRLFIKRNGSNKKVIAEMETAAEAENKAQAEDTYEDTVEEEGADHSFGLYKVGSTVMMSGRFETYDESENEGQFDLRNYYLIRGIEGHLTGCRIVKKSEKYNLIYEKMAIFRQKAENVFKTYMEEDDAGVMEALVLGDKNELDSEIKDIYQNAGMSHILSLSGLHIAAAGLFLIKLLKKTSLPIAACHILAIMIMLMYAIVTGMSVSTQRALIMFILAITADIIGRTYDFLSAASLSSVIILVLNPYYILDSGFLLSFGAVVAIGCVFPSMCELFGISKAKEKGISGNKNTCKEKNKYIKSELHVKATQILEKTWEGIILSFSINLTTLPVIAASFYKTSRYSFLANIIVIPLMSLLLFTGFLGMFTGMLQYTPIVRIFNGFPVISAYLTTYILKISHVILKIYIKIAEIISNLYKNMWVLGKPTGLRIATYYILFAIAVAAGFYKGVNRYKMTYVDHISLHNIENNTRYYVKKHNKITISTLFKKNNSYKPENRINKGNISVKTKDMKINRTMLDRILPVIFICFIVVSLAILTNRKTAALEIRNISVGQGDCGVVFGKNTPVILIDGGSSSVKNVGKYRITPVLLSNGVSCIDYVFLTHLDDDHTNGVFELLENMTGGIEIKKIIISAAYRNSMNSEETDKLNKLKEAAEKAGCGIYTMSAGEKINAGNILITCVWPDLNYEFSDENDKSLVLNITRKGEKLSSLFTGDISSDAEEKILECCCDDKSLLDCDYLKVAHHGSRYSSSEAFLSNVTPVISAVSVGEGNSYGHPSVETLSRLEAVGNLSRSNRNANRIFRTDTCGEIITASDKNVVRCRTYK